MSSWETERALTGRSWQRLLCLRWETYWRGPVRCLSGGDWDWDWDWEEDDGSWQIGRGRRRGRAPSKGAAPRPRRSLWGWHSSGAVRAAAVGPPLCQTSLSGLSWSHFSGAPLFLCFSALSLSLSLFLWNLYKESIWTLTNQGEGCGAPLWVTLLFLNLFFI